MGRPEMTFWGVIHVVVICLHLFVFDIKNSLLVMTCLQNSPQAKLLLEFVLATENPIRIQRHEDLPKIAEYPNA